MHFISVTGMSFENSRKPSVRFQFFSVRDGVLADWLVLFFG